MKRSLYALVFSTEKRFLAKNDDASNPGLGLMLIVALIYFVLLAILKLFGVYNYIKRNEVLHFLVSDVFLFGFVCLAFRVFKKNYISPESLSDKERKSGKRLSWTLFIGGALMLAIIQTVYERYIK